MKIIQHHLNFRPTEDWITTQSGLPFLKLDLEIPVTDIAQELEEIASLAVYHRAEESFSEKFFYGHKGWKSLALYGVHYRATEDVEGDKTWTEVGLRCLKTKQWLEDNFVINEHTGRIRLMILEPGGYILPHVDRERKFLSEINIAITNPTGCCFRFTNHGNVPFTPGTAFMLDISNQHLVYNDSNNTRLHIIVHGKLKDTSVITKSYEDRYRN